MGVLYYCRKRLAARSAASLRKAIERGNYAAVRQTVARHPYLVHWPTGRAAEHPLHVAARTGRRRIVRMLVQRGRADPNARNARGQTPMHLCVLHRRHEAAGLLMDGGADPAAVDGSSNTPLDLAMMTEEKRCVDVLLSYDMPTSVASRAFYRAATRDKTVLMNKLLNRGAHIEYEDMATGFTALLMATKGKRVRTTQFLLEKGADPAVHDSSGWTCLHFAVYHGYPVQTLVTMLVERGAGGRLVDCRTRDRETALHLAARKGNETAAWALLQAGAAADLVDRKGRTPLLTALRWRQCAVARCLVYAGANVNRVPGSCWAPLQAAVADDNVPLARLLLERGSIVVDPRRDDLDWTVIHSVCQTGATGMLEWLLAYTESDALHALHEDGRRQPPLVVAVTMGRRAAVEALLARGVDVNARCRNGETALHAAVRADRAPLVDRLLDAGACVDARDTAADRRPLDVALYTWGRRSCVTAHLIHADRVAKAVVRHDVDAVAFLLASGITPNMTTEAYGSPLHVAVRHRRYRMMAAILASGRCRPAVRHRGVTALDHALAAGDARAADMILSRYRDIQHAAHTIFFRDRRDPVHDSATAAANSQQIPLPTSPPPTPQPQQRPVVARWRRASI